MFAINHKMDVNVGEHTVTVRKLSGDELEDARDARSVKQAVGLRNIGGEILKVLRSDELAVAAEALGKKKVDVAALKKERYNSFDRRTVLRHGIVRWSFQGEDGKPLDVNDASRHTIEEKYMQQLHEAIVDYSLGPIDAAEAEAATGKD